MFKSVEDKVGGAVSTVKVWLLLGALLSAEAVFVCEK